MEKAIALALGSLAGGFSRYFLTLALGRWMGESFPYGTFAVNLLGCFLIGFFDSAFSNRWPFSPAARLLLMTGFCGAFTTFSTFIFESSRMLQAGEFFKIFLYIVLSVAAGLFLFRAGVWLGKAAF